MSDIQHSIDLKRAGKELTEGDIADFVAAYVAGAVNDNLAAEWLRAVYAQDMSPAETLALTRAMLASGVRADLSAIAGVKVGKHSTGGVGDKVSLLAAPMAAACGAMVPKLSGRGLGHTGGTLDKLEAIPGLRTDLTPDEFARILKETGLCFGGQTSDIAPADKKLYALRNETGTVDHAGLIAASIMSKKLAEGLDALVLDVKCGHGAFMRDLTGAEELARAMVGIGAGAGVRTTALITAMDQPLGACVGNSLEIAEVVALLRGSHMGPPPAQSTDLVQVALAVAGHMVLLAGRAESFEQGRDMAKLALRNGAALARFTDMIRAQGGDARVVEDASLMGSAPSIHMVTAEHAGIVADVDALAVGRGCVELGAGRKTKTGSIDPLCGVVLHTKIGDAVQLGAPLAEIHYSNSAKLDAALPHFAAAWRLSNAAPAAPAANSAGVILKTISST